jgi:CysZ protein
MITRPGLRVYVLVPLLINTALFTSLIYFGAQYFDRLMARLIPESLVANLIGAPFNDRLSEKVAERLGFKPAGTQGHSLVGDVAASILGELRKWLYFLGLMALVVIVWFIPLVNFVAPFLWLVLSAWMLAVEYGDYPLANAGLGRFTERRAWLRRHRWQALGFGAATLAVTMIPIVNFAVMPAAVAGATLLWYRQDQVDS